MQTQILMDITEQYLQSAMTNAHKQYDKTVSHAMIHSGDESHSGCNSATNLCQLA